MDTLEGRVWGQRMPKDRLTLQIILVFTLASKHLFRVMQLSLFMKPKTLSQVPLNQ